MGVKYVDIRFNTMKEAADFLKKNAVLEAEVKTIYGPGNQSLLSVHAMIVRNRDENGVLLNEDDFEEYLKEFRIIWSEKVAGLDGSRKFYCKVRN